MPDTQNEAARRADSQTTVPFRSASQMEREQLLVDLIYEIALASSRVMHRKSFTDIASWVKDHLKKQGVETEPEANFWGVLKC